MENSMEVPQKLKIELPYDPAIPLLGIYPKDVKAGSQRDAHPCSIHNSKEVEATQMSIDRWMDKQNVVYTYNGIFP